MRVQRRFRKRVWHAPERLIVRALPGLFCLAFFAATAYADTVSIGLQQSGGISTVASGTGSASFSGPFGSFSNVLVTGAGQSTLTPPDVLFANSIDTATAAGGTLNIFVTDQGLTNPSGSVPLVSSFTSNLLPAGWTVTEATFLSPANALFSGNPLDANTFSAIGT